MMKRTLAAGLAALLLASAATLPSQAAPVKVGMITTLSGGGAGLGIDVRDGFMLALKQAGDAGAEVEVIAEDDQQKPDVAVQIADKMIQSDQVDILTGII
ncbi:ABC transporter substrate-binding protein, partial [uncultured Amaricoccus sp.]